MSYINKTKIFLTLLKVYIVFFSLFNISYVESRYTHSRNNRINNNRRSNSNSRKNQMGGNVNNHWIIVPWTSGGHYYHNTLTREDVDKLPPNVVPKNYRL